MLDILVAEDTLEMFEVFLLWDFLSTGSLIKNFVIFQWAQQWCWWNLLAGSSSHRLKVIVIETLMQTIYAAIVVQFEVGKWTILTLLRGLTIWSLLFLRLIRMTELLRTLTTNIMVIKWSERILWLVSGLVTRWIFSGTLMYDLLISFKVLGRTWPIYY